MRQHGVASLQQLLQLGYSRTAVTRAAAGGRLYRLYRGVYAVGHTNLSPRGECLAAVLGGGPGALLSHHSAAWLWGIAKWSHAPLSVTGPIRRAARPPIRQHHSTILATQDCDVIDGVPVTAVPRTVLDLAVTLRRDRLQRLLQRAEELRLFDLRHFEDVLARAGGHRGAHHLRHALAIYRPAPFTRSGLERRFLELVLESGLPRPSTGYVEAGYELDVYWPEERFGVELDTYETHGSHQSFEDDRVRDETLKLADVETLRVSGHRLDREPRQVIERVALLLKRRREQRPKPRPKTHPRPRGLAVEV